MNHHETGNQPRSPATILVVDDDSQNVELLTAYLKQEDLCILSALDGPAALNMLETQIPDLILLDIMMPEMDGFEVCRRLKDQDTTKDIPVIFITSSDGIKNKLMGFDAGGVDYLTKPFHRQEVLARVTVHLTDQQLHRQLQQERARFQALSEASFEGILLYETDRIIEANQTLVTLSGYPRDALIGMPVVHLLTPSWHERVWQHLHAEDAQPCEAELLTQEGRSMPIELQMRTITWQEQQVRMAAIRDISWRRLLEQENRALRVTLQDRDHFGAFVGNSPAMHIVYKRIIRAAAADETIIIYGETGTGKELAARTIFELSDQHATTFVPVNCGAIPENLFEPQFFGYRKGAFTGAERDTPGYFDQAQGGTLFLDEVGELTLSMQVKLLRVLQDSSYTPVGATTSRQANVRIIAATNRELRDLMRVGKVREDFFHRLHVIALELPPLRRHKEDIPLLIDHFLAQRASPGSPPPTIPEAILERFVAYDWPGNVRELLNEVRRYVATGEIELIGQPPAQADPLRDVPFLQDGLPLSEAVEAFERYYITRMLHHHGGQKVHTADALGVGRKTLYNKLKKYEEV